MKRGTGCLVALVIVIALFASVIIRLNEIDNERNRRNIAEIALSEVYNEIKRMYMDYVSDHKAPPSKLEDLEPYAKERQKGFEAVKNGQWVVLWGTKLSSNPRSEDDVIAHETRIFTEGYGCVMMGHYGLGMSANEFRERMDAIAVLHEIARMYLAFCDDHKKPPSNMDDLETYARDCPKGFKAISNGEWTVLWNTIPSDDPGENYDRILAYEKRQTDRSWDWILTVDGSGIQVIAEDLPKWMEATPVLHEIGRMYLAYWKDHTKAPSGLDDLKQYTEQNPKGFEAIRKGQWIVRWGTDISDSQQKNSHRVLAYDKEVLSLHTVLCEGWILMADNTGQKMNAEELDRALENGE
jgi:hypothetical protein